MNSVCVCVCLGVINVDVIVRVYRSSCIVDVSLSPVLIILAAQYSDLK